MPGRHRQSVPPRVLPKRLVAAGASGVVTVLAFAPIAHADTPGDDVTTSAAPSSDAPTSDAPSSDTPTSAAPSSDAPSSDASGSAAPSSDAPSSDAPSSDASSSPAPASTAPTSSVPASSTAPAAKKRAVLAEPDYGSYKLTVAVDQRAGSYTPPGATTAGSTFEIVETMRDGTVVTSDCTTATSTAPSSQCFVDNVAGSTFAIRQLTASAGYLVDPTTQQLAACTDPDIRFSIDGGGGFFTIPGCSATLRFTDGGLPPVVSAAAQTLTVTENGSVTVGPDSQINRQGAPATSVDVDQPAHGAVSVNQAVTAAAVTTTPVIRPFTLTYTPAKGYVGPDSFRYRVTTANGTSAYVTVSLRVVGAAPTASNDKVTTPEGDAVRIAVLGNDDANGGGTLRISDIADPGHGTAKASGSRIVYTPADGFSGTDRFSYTISTYSGTATATVTVTVAAAAADDGAGVDSTTQSTADTGVPSGALLEIGGALLLTGAGATVVGRRRRGLA